MAFDPKGRIIVSDQDDKGVFRVTLRDESDPNSRVQVESLKGFPYEPIKWGSERTVRGALAKAVSWLLGEVAVDLSELPTAKGPGRTWTAEDLTKLFKEPLQSRNLKNGEKMFAAGRCIVCHRIHGSGGYSGPDLGSVGSRYSIADIAASIIKPSQTISEQYQASTIKLKSGDLHYGKIIYRNKDTLAFAPSAFNPSQIQKIPSDEVALIELSNVSMMPEGLINGMNEEEVRNLFAYMIAGGHSTHKVFKK